MIADSYGVFGEMQLAKVMIRYAGDPWISNRFYKNVWDAWFEQHLGRHQRYQPWQDVAK